MFSRLIKIAVFTLLTYFLQATVAYHLALWDIAPNLALAMIAIVSVALGRKYTFLVSLAIGYLLEIMMPMLNYINLILYPVCAMLGALAFSDKSERKLEEERTTDKRRKMLHPHLRTPLCAMLSVLVFEAVHMLYIYLNGVAWDVGHITRAMINVIYTTVLSAVLQFPVRWWFGMYRKRDRQARQKKQE